MANAFKRYTERSVGTTAVTVGSYTVGSSTETTLIGLTVANVYTASINVDVVLNDGVNDTYVVKEAPVPTGGTLVVVGGDQKIVLEAGDSIKVSSSDAASADVIMSLLEIT